MTALLRYAVVKSMREHFLAILLLAPLVLTCAPMLGVAVFAALRGAPSLYPFHIPALSPAETSRIFGGVTVVMAALVAAVGAFWIFRSEIGSRAVHFFFLAGHPRAVSRASTVYGLAAGTLSYALARVVVSVLTSSPPEHALRELGIATLLALVGSAIGSLLVAVSAEVTILIPVYGGAVVASVLLVDSLNSPDAVRMAVAALFAAVLLQVAPIVLRWRCAS